jgi:L-asparaginase
VAAHGPVAELGPVLVLDGLIHAARFATKVSALSVGGWGSPAAGPVGRVVEGRPSVWLAPAYDDFLGTPGPGELPRVELVRMAIGAAPDALGAVLGTGPAGLVIDGFGGGHVPPGSLAVIDDAIAQGTPVVMASRVGDGPTNRSTYGAPGCELDLQERGALMAGAISGVKARLRLSVALALGMGAADVFPLD